MRLTSSGNECLANGHRISIGNWSADQILRVSDDCHTLTLTEAKDVLDMVQQHLIQMVSDLWNSRACLVSGKQPKTRTRHFRKGETFYVVPEGRGQGIHTSFSAVRLLHAPWRGFKMRPEAEAFLATIPAAPDHFDAMEYASPDCFGSSPMDQARRQRVHMMRQRVGA